MEFNKIIKEVLFPQISQHGFEIAREYKGYINFVKDNFSITASYDYSFSKDFHLEYATIWIQRTNIV